MYADVSTLPFRCKVSLSCFEGSTDVHSTTDTCPCGANLVFVDLTKARWRAYTVQTSIMGFASLSAGGGSPRGHRREAVHRMLAL